jgi:hypothetical protein
MYLFLIKKKTLWKLQILYLFDMQYFIQKNLSLLALKIQRSIFFKISEGLMSKAFAIRAKVSRVMFNKHPGFLMNHEINKVNKFIDIYNEIEGVQE